MPTEFEQLHRLRIVREIARGGMGTVSEALLLGADGFEKRVAIKQLLPALSGNRAFVDLFIAEAKLVADLVHENIVQIYQLSARAGMYYIVMEYVHGVSLAAFLQRHAAGVRPPEALAVFIASRIARGLAYAHSRLDPEGQPMNVVHCDVCPNNILITTEGLPKLTDFGIAKAARVFQSRDEREQLSLGKMAYMSPEQAWQRPVDYRSDIYGIGLVLFELLAMRRARQKWIGNPLFAAARGRIDWDALPADTSPALRGLLERMLAPDPDRRYADTSRVAHDLEYHIYHGGYGPTVVTLETYLRELFPDLYRGR